LGTTKEQVLERKLGTIRFPNPGSKLVTLRAIYQRVIYDSGTTLVAKAIALGELGKNDHPKVYQQDNLHTAAKLAGFLTGPAKRTQHNDTQQNVTKQNIDDQHNDVQRKISIMMFSVMTLSIITLSLMMLRIKTLSIKTLNIIALNTLTLSILNIMTL
jgi:hypothetical protein